MTVKLELELDEYIVKVLSESIQYEKHAIIANKILLSSLGIESNRSVDVDMNKFLSDLILGNYLKVRAELDSKKSFESTIELFDDDEFDDDYY